jgi:DNA-binding NarL/FixJ family response regulator
MRQRSLLLISSHDLGWGDLRVVLRTIEHVCICGEAASAREATRLVAACKPDVIISAATVDDAPALPLLVDIRYDLCPKSKLIVIGTSFEPDDLLAYAELGVAGLLQWGELSVESLRHCLAAAIGADVVVGSRHAVTALLSAGAAPAPWRGGPVRLTERERAVLRRLAGTPLGEEIARAEHLSLRTVKRTVAGLDAKLDAPSAFVLGMRAAQLGLVS